MSLEDSQPQPQPSPRPAPTHLTPDKASQSSLITCFTCKTTQLDLISLKYCKSCLQEVCDKCSIRTSLDDKNPLYLLCKKCDLKFNKNTDNYTLINNGNHKKSNKPNDQLIEILNTSNQEIPVKITVTSDNSNSNLNLSEKTINKKNNNNDNLLKQNNSIINANNINNSNINRNQTQKSMIAISDVLNLNEKLEKISENKINSNAAEKSQNGDENANNLVNSIRKKAMEEDSSCINLNNNIAENSKVIIHLNF